MNKDNIITLPHADLRKRSVRVGIITDEIKAVIKGMCDATLDWEASREHEVGVALAAIQVDKLYRIVVVRNNFDDKNDHEFTTFINPVIAKYEGKLVDDFEGCLSVKDVYGVVPRYERVKVDAVDQDGQKFRVTAEGFLARVFQHEIDHTNGIVFIDHIRDNKEAFYILGGNGKLKKLNYDKDIANNSILWE